MRLSDRFDGIISAKLNGAIDEFDDPERRLHQTVRELEAATRSAMAAAARAVADEWLLRRQLARHRRQVQHWHDRAIAAVSRGDEDSARMMLVRKRVQRQLAAALAHRLATAQETGRNLRRQVEAAEVRLAAARLGATHGAAMLDDRAPGRFERMCLRIDRAEATAEALLELCFGYLFSAARRSVKSTRTARRGEAAVKDEAWDLDVEAELEELKRHGTQ